MEKRLHRERMTAIQLQMLVDVLSENPELVSGRLTPRFTSNDRKKKWQAVATLLNSKDLGPRKEADKWRKSWSDLKFSVRSKAAKIELAGGADLLCEKLTNLEKRVLQMTGDVSFIEIPEKEETEATAYFSKLNEYNKNAVRNSEEMVLPISVSKIADVPEGSDNMIDEHNDNNDSNNYIGYDYKEEALEITLSESDSLPPLKKRRTSTENACDSTQAIAALQKQMEVQTAVFKEQTHIMKDIAKSLQLIAKALQKT